MTLQPLHEAQQRQAADNPDQYSAWPAERELICDLIRNLPEEQIVVEIGAYRGATSIHLARACESRMCFLTCIDPWDNTTEGGQADYCEFRRRLSEPGVGFDLHVESIRDYSLEVAKRTALQNSEFVANNHPTKPIKLIFLDGDHRYPAPLLDLQAWYPLLAPGGWMVMHDYYDVTWGPGVRRSLREFIQALPGYGDGLTIHTQQYLPTPEEAARVGHGPSGLVWWQKPASEGSK